MIDSVSARFNSSTRRLLLLLLVALAAIPSALVILDRWYDDARAADWFRQSWESIPFLASLGLPPYFEAIFIITPAILALAWFLATSAPGAGSEEHAQAPAPAPRASDQRRTGLRWIALALVGLVIVWVRQAVFGAVPGWDLAVLFLFFAAGWFLFDGPVEAVGRWLKNKWRILAVYLTIHAALLIALAAYYTPQHLTFVSAAFVLIGALLAFLCRKSIHPIFWVFSIALVVLSLNLDSWQWSIVGDEFSFYSYAREIVERQDIGFILGHIFVGTAVYSSHPYFSSLIQASAMKLLDVYNFGWRFGAVYVSALSIPFFYFFVRNLASRRVALIAAFLLGVSNYLADFSKVGYNNTQALLALCVGLAAATWAIRRPHYFAFVVLGAALAFCFYVYPVGVFAPVVILLLLLIYHPPTSRQSLLYWALMGVTLFILISPLLTQPDYWTSKLPGTFLSHPEATTTSSSLLANLRENVIYALYSFLYIPQESHFVTVGYLDGLTAALVFIGFGIQLSRANKKFEAFNLASLLLMVLLIGSTHGLRFPPTTRMYMLLPAFCILAASALDWLLAELRPVMAPRFETPVLLAALGLAMGLSIYQANVESPRRSGGYQNVSEQTLRLAQAFVITQPNATPSFVMLNDPDTLNIPGLNDILQTYYLSTSVQEVNATSTQPQDVQDQLLAENSIVIVNPRLPEDVQSNYEGFLGDNGLDMCELRELDGNLISHGWWVPDSASTLCSLQPSSMLLPYTTVNSAQLLPTNAADGPMAIAFLALLALAIGAVRDWEQTRKLLSDIRLPVLPFRAPAVITTTQPNAVVAAPSAPNSTAVLPLPRDAERSSLAVRSGAASNAFEFDLDLRVRIRFPRPAAGRVKTLPAASNGSNGGPATAHVQVIEQGATGAVAVEPQAPARVRNLGARLLRLPRLGQAEAIKLPALSWRWMLVEWAALALVVVAFARGILDLNPNRIPFGNEYEVIASLDLVVTNALRQFGQFPLWNGYLRAGQPLFADPFLHVYNPVSTIPILLLGVVNGFKVALALTFVLAALGQWWFSRALGMNRAARLWTALLYALNGQAAARFVQGEYDFTLGYAWIPFVLAGLTLALRTRERKYYSFTALALALLFLSGNVYYAYYMAIILGLFTLIGAAHFRGFAFKGWAWDRLLPLAAIALLGIGLAAVELIPVAEMWPNIRKIGDAELKTSQPVPEVMQDFLSTSTERPAARDAIPPEDFYGYIGIVPFGLAVLALGAWSRGWRKEILLLAALFIFVLLFVSIRYTPVADLASRSGFLSQFRYPSRIIIFGSIAVITLAGLGVTWLWGEFDKLGKRQGPGEWAVVGTALVVLVMLYGVVDVFQANGRFLAMNDRFVHGDEILGWLHNSDTQPHYVAIPDSTGWHLPVISNQERLWNAWYGFDFIPPAVPNRDFRDIGGEPNYIVIPSDKQPTQPDAVEAKQFDADTVYRLNQSLPFTFAVSQNVLEQKAAGPLARSDVQPLTAQELGPNALAVTGSAADSSTWVVAMTSFYPGWRVSIDGRPAELKTVGNYLAVQAQPGQHRYVFEFDPISFKLGLAITLVSIIVTIALVSGLDRRIAWSQLKLPSRLKRTSLN